LLWLREQIAICVQQPHLDSSGRHELAGRLHKLGVENDESSQVSGQKEHYFITGSQAMPARRSDKDSMKVKTLGR
jgi:hypothetical protein